MKLVVIDKTHGRLVALYYAIFPSEKNRVLHKVFDVLIKEPEINLADTEGTIILAIKKPSQAQEGGATDSHLLAGNILRMRLNSKNDLSVIVRSFCHEMIHARQIFKKQLSQNRNWVMWNGKRIPALQTKIAQIMAGAGASMGSKALMKDYEQLPWEKEAFSLDTTLYRRVRKKLTDK